ncbi:MAG TPA: glutathione S-transferase family protein, partial [Kofleriaceae bacterium]|nr:glutathione S-transferase family protein [Kofleriaceae bacterium]
AADRFWDLHVHQHMQVIVGDRLRPEGAKDSFGVAQARAKLAESYAIADRTWAAEVRDDFTIADCAAAPALFFAQKLVPIDAYPTLAAYYARLRARPSVARTFDEAAPYLAMFPGA